MSNWYVRPTGVGNQSGTGWSDAWGGFGSISWANVKAGDTIYVGAGTYTSGLTFAKGGSSSASIQVKAAQDTQTGQVVLYNCGVNLNGKSFIEVNGHFEGKKQIKIQNSNYMGAYSSVDEFIEGIELRWLDLESCGSAKGHHGIHFHGTVRNITIDHCRIYNSMSDGVNFLKGTPGSDLRFDNVVISYCEITWPTTNVYRGDDGVQSGGWVAMTVRNCLLRGGHTWKTASGADLGHPDGIQTQNGMKYMQIYNNVFCNWLNSAMFLQLNNDGTMQHIYIFNNVIYVDSNHKLDVARGIQLACRGSTTPGWNPTPEQKWYDVYVCNNLFAGLDLFAINLEEKAGGDVIDTKRVHIDNNIIVNCYRKVPTSGHMILHSGWSYDPITDDHTLNNNILWKGSAGSGSVSWHGSSYTSDAALNAAPGASGNQFNAPAFVNYTPLGVNNDFHSLATSIAVNNGFDWSAKLGTTDKDGFVRVVPWDVGPYEYGSGSVPEPDPPGPGDPDPPPPEEVIGAMGFLKQSTAAVIRIGPFLDATDAITPETGLTISQADIRLSKNGAAFAQKTDATAAAHDENGWYAVALDATDTNTVGNLLIAIAEAGALPVWSEFTVLKANVYDAIVGGTDFLDVNVEQVEGVTATAQIGDATADEAYETGYTLRELMRLAVAVLLGKTNTGGTVFRDIGDTKARVTATLDASNNRTAMTYDDT